LLTEPALAEVVNEVSDAVVDLESDRVSTKDPGVTEVTRAR
jgi:hypothetical protein